MKRSGFFSFYIAALISLILFLPVTQAAVVCSVHDGDTIRMCDGERVRLWGVDAPELKQPMGQAARDYASSIFLFQDVSLDCTGKSYNRQVCRVSANGMDLNALMVENGFAFDSPKYSRGYYQAAQNLAQQARVGVWQLPDGGMRPWTYRHAVKSAKNNS